MWSSARTTRLWPERRHGTEYGVAIEADAVEFGYGYRIDVVGVERRGRERLEARIFFVLEGERRHLLSLPPKVRVFVSVEPSISAARLMPTPARYAAPVLTLSTGTSTSFSSRRFAERDLLQTDGTDRLGLAVQPESLQPFCDALLLVPNPPAPCSAHSASADVHLPILHNSMSGCCSTP